MMWDLEELRATHFTNVQAADRLRPPEEADPSSSRAAKGKVPRRLLRQADPGEPTPPPSRTGGVRGTVEARGYTSPWDPTPPPSFIENPTGRCSASRPPSPLGQARRRRQIPLLPWIDGRPLGSAITERRLLGDEVRATSLTTVAPSGSNS